MISIHLTPLYLVDVVKAFFGEVLSKLSCSRTKYYVVRNNKGRYLITLSGLFAKFSDEICRKMSYPTSDKCDGCLIKDQEKFM